MGGLGFGLIPFIGTYGAIYATGLTSIVKAVFLSGRTRPVIAQKVDRGALLTVLLFAWAIYTIGDTWFHVYRFFTDLGRPENQNIFEYLGTHNFIMDIYAAVLLVPQQKFWTFTMASSMVSWYYYLAVEARRQGLPRLAYGFLTLFNGHSLTGSMAANSFLHTNISTYFANIYFPTSFIHILGVFIHMVGIVIFMMYREGPMMLTGVGLVHVGMLGPSFLAVMFPRMTSSQEDGLFIEIAQSGVVGTPVRKESIKKAVKTLEGNNGTIRAMYGVLAAFLFFVTFSSFYAMLQADIELKGFPKALYQGYFWNDATVTGALDSFFPPFFLFLIIPLNDFILTKKEVFGFWVLSLFVTPFVAGPLLNMYREQRLVETYKLWTSNVTEGPAAGYVVLPPLPVAGDASPNWTGKKTA